MTLNEKNIIMKQGNAVQYLAMNTLKKTGLKQSWTYMKTLS